MTNDRKHRKAYPVGDSWQRRKDSVDEPLFDWRSLEVAGKKLGIGTCSADGVKGGDMRGRNHELNSGESLLRPTVGVGKRRYKPTGESLGDAEQEVGDGHSTDDAMDRITMAEGRVVSLNRPRQRKEEPA